MLPGVCAMYVRTAYGRYMCAVYGRYMCAVYGRCMCAVYGRCMCDACMHNVRLCLPCLLCACECAFVSASACKWTCMCMCICACVGLDWLFWQVPGAPLFPVGLQLNASWRGSKGRLAMAEPRIPFHKDFGGCRRRRAEGAGKNHVGVIGGRKLRRTAYLSQISAAGLSALRLSASSEHGRVYGFSLRPV